MKPPSDDHDLIRWLDGEMNDSESAAFEERLSRDPALNQEAREMKALSASIRTHLPAELKVPHADFFNSQIQIRIDQMERELPRSRPESAVASLLAWFRQPWFAVAGATAVIALGFLALRTGESDANSRILSSYTPNADVQARTYHDDSAQATVLMLDGLDEVPADRKVSGLNVHRSETEPEVAATTLYDVAGSRLLMISSDAAGHPMFLNSPRG